MSNFLIVGTAGANIVFGAEDIGYADVGTIVSGGKNLGGDKVEIKDSYGNVVAVVYFNDKNECTVDIIFDSTVTYPVRGDSLSLMGLTIVLVDEVDQKWDTGKECMLSIKATKYALLATS